MKGEERLVSQYRESRGYAPVIATPVPVPAGGRPTCMQPLQAYGGK